MSTNGKPKINPGKLTTKQRLADAIRERDEASASCVALIRELELFIKFAEDKKWAITQKICDAQSTINRARRGK